MTGPVSDVPEASKTKCLAIARRIDCVAGTSPYSAPESPMLRVVTLPQKNPA